MSHILSGNDLYWTEFMGHFGIQGTVVNAVLCIKSNGDVNLKATMKDETQIQITGLASHSFLIHILETLNIPVSNHVLEICLDIQDGQIATVTYVCAGDSRLRDVNWQDITLFRSELR